MSNRYRDLSTDKSYEDQPRFPVDQGATEPKKRTGVIKNAPNVRLREAPDKNGKTLAILREGRKVEILDKGIETNGFKHVFVSDVNLKGYIASDFCKLNKDI